MPEIRTRKNARRIGQNTDAGKRMLDSFLRSKQAEVGSENSETEYAADDTVLTVITYQYEFDADGNVLHLQVFTDGTLTRDEVYAYDENGWTYLSVSTEYLEDGSYRVTTYYADGESDYVLYNADGAVIEES